MSLTTHRFQSVETLARAQEWLGRIGIGSDRIEVSSTGLPSLTIQTEFARLPEVEMILNAAELTDPDGWPAWDQSDPAAPFRFQAAPEPSRPDRVQTAPIGWHPVD